MTDAYMGFLQGISSRSFSVSGAQSGTSNGHPEPPRNRCYSQELFVDFGYPHVFRRKYSLPSADPIDGYLENVPTDCHPGPGLTLLNSFALRGIADLRKHFNKSFIGCWLRSEGFLATDLKDGQTPESTSEAVKNTVRTWWANMKYSWNAINSGAQIDISDLSGADPIYLLGQVYHNKNNPSSFKHFLADFSTRIWFTYRQGFQPMQNTGHTSDSGWGCMLRSAQMILAQALVVHLLGRRWRWNPKQQEHGVHRQIIKWFSDDPDPLQAPFGLHNMIKAAAALSGKKAGDWFGPSMAAYLLKRCLEEPAENADYKNIFEQIAIYVAQDCTIYIQDVFDLCTTNPQIEWKSVVILIPVRLGGECINLNYIHCVKEVLAYQNCLGIIGGKPRHSLYFVGFQANKLVYLDPHYPQKATDTSKEKFPLNSYHCATARKMSFSKLDPSAAIGFFCKTRRDFENFITSMQSVTEMGPQNNGYPVFIISNGSSTLVSQSELLKNDEQVLRVQRNIITAQGSMRREFEEYVVL